MRATFRKARFIQSHLPSTTRSPVPAVFLRWPLQQARNQKDIVFHCPVRQQSEFLDHISDLTPQLNRIEFEYVLAIDEHRALTWLEHAIDEPEGRCLAGTTAPKQNQRFSPLNLETEIVQDRPLSGRVADLLKGKVRQ